MPDAVDACPDTPPGDLVNNDGCSACPCDGTPGGARWTSRIAYIRCVKGRSRQLFLAGEISQGTARGVVRGALISTCGRENVTRCCVARRIDRPRARRNQCRVMTTAYCNEQVTTGLATDADIGSCLPNPCN